MKLGLNMKIVLYYLSTRMAGSILISLLALTALLSASNFIAIAEDIGEELTISEALQSFLLDFIVQSYDFFPVAVLIGCAIALVGLSDKRELLALLALGYSRRVIHILSLGFAGLLMLIMFVFGEIVVPQAAARLFEIEHDKVHSVGGAQQTDGGYWIRRGANYIFFKGEKGKEGTKQNRRLEQAEHVTVYNIDERKRISNIFYAQRAQWQPDALRLIEGEHVQIGEDGLRKPVPFKQHNIVTSVSHASLEYLPAQAMNVFQLWQHIKLLRHSMMNTSTYELEFWNRFSMILTIPIMLLLALLWAFAPPRTDQVSRHAFTAILLGIAYALLSRLISNVSIVWGEAPLLGAALPVILFLVIYNIFFRRLSQ